MFAQIGQLLVDVAATFLVFLLLARFHFQWLRVSFRNPLGEFIIAASDWLVRPARRVIPPLAGLDLATLLSALLVQVLALYLLHAIAGFAAGNEGGRYVALLVAGAAYDQRLPPFAKLAAYPRVSALAFRALGPRRVVRAVLRSVVHDRARVDAEQVRGYADPLSPADAVRALIAAARQIRPTDLDRLTARYPDLAVPTLLLWGGQDRVVPPWVGQRLERDLPDARLHVFDRCGHLLADELPDESWDVLESFLDER